MTEKERRYVIAYDISCDMRRLKIAHVLQSYGDRIQLSVFIVDLRPARLVVLKRSLVDLMDQASDSLFVCDTGPVGVGSRGRMEFIGRGRPLSGDSPPIY